jgi:hypothetical protein
LRFWQEYTLDRPDWAKIKSKNFLTTTERVRLDRNISWRDFLATTAQEIPRGQKCYLTPLAVAPPAPAAIAPLVPPPAAPAKRAAQPPVAPAAKKTAAKKRKEPELEPDEEDFDDYGPPKKRQRKLTSDKEDRKYAQLLVAATGQSSSTLQKWIASKYPQYSKSITVTTKEQTLRALAFLLTQE